MGNLCPCLNTESSEYSPIPDAEDKLHSLQVEAVTLASPARSPAARSPAARSPAARSPARSPAPSLPATTTDGETASVVSAPETAVFHPIPDVAWQGDQQFDMDSPVFTGMVVEQKVFSRWTYGPQYVWINLTARTLCLSEHNSRNRSHRQATLADVVGIIAGPPERYKAPVGADGHPVQLSPDLCMSVKFVRGGGIDLKFQSISDRDMWYDAMARIVTQQRELEGKSASGRL